MRFSVPLILLLLTVGCVANSTGRAPAAWSPPLEIPTRVAIPRPTGTPAPSPTPGGLAITARFPLLSLPGLGRAPFAVAVAGDKAYVVNAATDNIAVLQNGKLSRFIRVGRRPGSIIADAERRRVYVANNDDRTMSIIADDVVTRTISIGDAAGAMALVDNRLFIGLENQGTILVLDRDSFQTVGHIAIDKAFGIINLAGDDAHHRLYADVYEKVAVIDSRTATVVSSFATPGSYFTLAVNPRDGTVYANAYEAATSSQFLVAYEPASGAAKGRVRIGNDPRSARVTGDGTRVYVANAYGNSISVIDPARMNLLASVAVGLQPYGLALDETAHRLYVANYNSDSVHIVDTNSNQVQTTVPMGPVPSALLANAGTGRVYVANASSDSVFVIQGDHIIREIAVGRHPVDLARDEQANQVVVANAADGTLTIIGESDWSVRSTGTITRTLAGIAIDGARSHLIANEIVLDLKTMAPVNRLLLRGNSLGATITPEWIRLNPRSERVYALGWNGTPGSNSRTAAYSVDAQTLTMRKMLEFNGSVSALEVDSDSGTVYAAGTHPLANTHELAVYDSNDRKLTALPLRARTVGMTLNPATHHLLLAHAGGSPDRGGENRSSPEMGIEILDTRSLGRVGNLAMPSPGRMTLLGNLVVVAGRDDGMISIVQDVALPEPLAPTKTPTHTPYPTLAPTRRASATAKSLRVATGTPRASVAATCSEPIASAFVAQMSPETRAQLGCPTQPVHEVNLASQTYEHGAMYYRSDEKNIVVLVRDMTWKVFDDAWRETQSEDSCPAVSVATGLIKPKRGFGLVWCNQTALRTKLGYATSAEMGPFAAPQQAFDRGQAFVPPNGKAVFMFSNGRWR